MHSWVSSENDDGFFKLRRRTRLNRFRYRRAKPSQGSFDL
ncbi:hypothetical protein BCEP27_10130 [Burkholderia cepacia]